MFPLLSLGACAERDNPFDPINLGLVPAPSDTPPRVAPEPRPSATSLVVDPDSACRDCLQYGNVGAALADAHPGDTIWIQGGRTYPVDLLNVSRGGTFLARLVIQAFGGEARFIPSKAGVQNLLRLDQPYVEFRNLAFVGAEGDGILVNNVEGPVVFDSVRIDSCGISGRGSALRAGPAGVLLSLRHVRLRHNASYPALWLDPGVVIDDSVDVVTEPRP
ncbi:MAG: hypothetical protein H6686_08270 [Fibrobacteria bacterium]|nr:hypothetical protein [Fibrobacteria bacterium]